MKNNQFVKYLIILLLFQIQTMHGITENGAKGIGCAIGGNAGLLTGIALFCNDRRTSAIAKGEMAVVAACVAISYGLVTYLIASDYTPKARYRRYQTIDTLIRQHTLMEQPNGLNTLEAYIEFVEHVRAYKKNPLIVTFQELVELRSNFEEGQQLLKNALNDEAADTELYDEMLTAQKEFKKLYDTYLNRLCFIKQAINTAA
jgi:hypothetical protein